MTDLKFNCSFYEQSGNQIYLRLDFKYNTKISQSIYGKDILHFKIYPNNLLVDKENNQTLDESSLDEQFMIKLLPMPKSIELAQETVELMEDVQMVILFIQLNLMVYQVLMAKSLQDLWAMLNT